MSTVHENDRVPSYSSILFATTVAGALASAASCQGKYDHFDPIVLDTCPGPCTDCEDDYEQYLCYLDVHTPAGVYWETWTGETCAPPNLHPSQISIVSYGTPCLLDCAEHLAAQELAGWYCLIPTETQPNGDFTPNMFREGPLCDSSLNDTGGGGPIGDGTGGTGGLMCEGDSGTGAYDEEPPVAVCPGWYQPSTLVASTPRPRHPGILDVHIDATFVENLKKDNFAPVVCDYGRYRNGRFMDVQAGELFHEVGFRSNDSTLEVRSFNPADGRPLTPWFSVDSPEGLTGALVALRDATGLNFKVQRSGAPNGSYEIWVKVIDCSGSCPAP